MLYYLATEQNMCDANLGEYRTSGILVVEEEKIVDGLLDISTDASKIRALAKSLNEGTASHLHFHEIIEDFMATELV